MKYLIIIFIAISFIFGRITTPAKIITKTIECPKQPVIDIEKACIGIYQPIIDELKSCKEENKLFSNYEQGLKDGLNKYRSLN